MSDRPRRIGLVVHSGRQASLDAATEASRILRDAGVEVVVADDGDNPEHVPAPAVPPDHFGGDVDLVISFGGDGTFLRAAHFCRRDGVPVLGVNLGRLGFLAEIEIDDLGPALERVAEGDYSIEDRSTLEVRVEGPDGSEIDAGWALNEVSVEKTARQRLLLMDVHVGNTLFAKVPADALVVATATGSTAYALSAGGPILSPRVEATLVVPVAPHTLFDRTLVAGPDEPVRVSVLPDQEPAVVSCDGRAPVSVEPGGAVHVTGGGRPVRLARVGTPDFYGLVRRKFGLH